MRVVGKGERKLLTKVRAKTGRRSFAKNDDVADVVLYWPRSTVEITPTLTELRRGIAQNGGIWVITAKRGKCSASGMEYLNQTGLIPLGLDAELVDNKTCSISEDESAMRFVIRKRDRK